MVITCLCVLNGFRKKKKFYKIIMEEVFRKVPKGLKLTNVESDEGSKYPSHGASVYRRIVCRQKISTVTYITSPGVVTGSPERPGTKSPGFVVFPDLVFASVQEERND